MTALQGLGEITGALGELFGKKRPRRPARNRVPSEFTLKGTLRPGKESEFRVEDQDLMIDAGTWVFGELEYGKKVTVKGVGSPNGLKYAKKVIVER